MGCGESKHAVATTESVSVTQRKKLSSSSSKRIEAATSSEPLKQATPIDNTTTGALPADPSAPQQPSTTSTEKNEEPEMAVDVKFDEGKETAAPVLEQNKDAGHDRTTSQETQYENANDGKSVYESPQHVDVKVEEDEVKEEAAEEKGEEVVKKEDQEIKEEGKPENVGEVKDKGDAATPVVAAIKEEEIAPAEENKNGPAAQVPSA